MLDWFAVGDDKKRENIVGGHETVKPAEVHERMKELLEKYNRISSVSFEDIVSFLIEDSKKMFYYRGLSKWPHEKGRLLDTCLDGQDTFKVLLDQLEISYQK